MLSCIGYPVTTYKVVVHLREFVDTVSTFSHCNSVNLEMVSYFLLLTLLAQVIGLASSKQASLVLTMLCRDEDVNLRANLPAWLSFVDYFVFVLDKRTTDRSVNTIESILGYAKKQFVIVTNEFEGFGAARTLSLKTAWEKFPQASHVLLADPDWSPLLATIQLHELDESVDVFRFTVLDAERDGVHNQRKMDWLLRNRPGLAMRYHLHEVVFIGDYTWKNIGWEIREVEKKGTWHSKVGHDTSTSAERYKFDLQLLYKDLALYGHDPHTHYYLGMTHKNIVSRLAAQGQLQSAEAQEHLARAIRYFELRVNSMYPEELLEERWGAIVELGNIYFTIKRNDLKSIYWYNACSDYNPKNVDCAVQLCQLYLGLGQLNPALQALEVVLKTERSPRRMSVSVDLWDCDIPMLAVDLYSKKAQVQGVSAEEAMYFFLLLQMTRASKCSNLKSPVVVNRSVRTLLNNAIGSQPVDYFETPNNFCANQALQRHLATRRYTIHPCAAVREALQLAAKCDIFSSTGPPPYEEFQIGSFERQFLGTAVLPDIIHHAHQGFASRFQPSDGAPLRFLFADYFEPQMLFNLLGQLQRQASDFEVVVVTPDAQAIAAMQDRISDCRAKLQPETVAKLSFKAVSLVQFVAAHKAEGGRAFSFIEYNGGLSKSADGELAAELAALHELLRTDGGVLGLTYFAANHHTSRLQGLVDSRNTTHMVPFSLEATRLVHNYLDQHKLGSFKTDHDLVVHLGGEVTESAFPLYRVNQLKPRVQWRSYSQQQATDLLVAAGFRIASWVPSAYAHPFEEIEHYEVQKFRAMGMSEEVFVQELMTNFRYSVYVVKNTTEAAGTGRKRLSASDFQHGASSSARNTAAAMTVVDRVGYLSGSFRSMEALAQQRQSTSIEFAHYALPGDTRFGFIVSPVIAPCLPHLSSRPSVQGLHDMNKQFAAREKREFDEMEAQDLLFTFLSYLEKLNMITYESDTLRPSAGSSGSKKGKPFKIESIADRIRSDERAKASSGTNAPPAKKFGGLNVKNANQAKPEAPKKEVPVASKQEPVKVVPETQPSLTSGPPNVPSSTFASASTVNGDSSAGAAASGLSYAEQVKRMRALGYSEDLIEEMLQDEKEAPVSAVELTGDALPPSPEAADIIGGDNIAATELSDKASTMPDKQQGQKDPQTIIDLLTRFTQQRKAETAAATAFKDSANQESTAVLEAAAGAPTETSPHTEPIAAATAPAQKPIFSFLAPAKQNAGKTDLKVGGGLKLPGDVTGKGTAEPAAAIKQPALNANKAASSVQPAGGASKDKDSAAQATLMQQKAQSIKLPAVQAEAALRKSIRSLDCLSSATADKQKLDCQEPKFLKRKTAHTASTSARKIEFDVAQLQYLQSQRAIKESDAAHSSLAALSRSYGDIATYLKDFKLDDPYRVVRLNSNSALKSKTEYLNRLVHLNTASGVDSASLVHAGAMQYLKSLRKELLTHDFLVVDVILQEAALRSISRQLLTSTVWFDVTNGAAFAAHHDEGLVFPEVHLLVQQVALALSSEDKPMAVSSFYALSMGLQHSAFSPVYMASKDDLNVVLWLSPQWSTESELEQGASDSDSGSDGLRIYDEASAGKLFSQGVSLYPSAHSDFLSRSSSLAIDLQARCNASHSEFIPRVPNRLVVVRSKKLCTLLTAGAADRARPFDQSTMIALVMVLTPSV